MKYTGRGLLPGWRWTGYPGRRMATFALVHGAGHGAWCWERLIPVLEALGHRAVAMDLPCEDPTAGVGRYAEVVDRAIPATTDLVLVGHSLAGLTIPLVAARRPVRRLVYLCAIVPELGRSLADQVAADPSLYHEVVRTNPGRLTAPDGATTLRDAAAARAIFYHDCTPEDVAWAFARLRPQAAAPRGEPCPLRAWPPGDTACILCREDHAISPAWSRRVARERLGVEPIELDGGHSPFISRPSVLAGVLDRLAR
ncbi:MAG TPA: alpha/beta fold hydrolase [Methylomirabilota bacterium]